MAANVTLSGYISENNELYVFNKEQLYKWIRSNRNKQVVIKLQSDYKPRSTRQNAYYWGVVVKMICSRLQDLGHDVNEVTTHDFLKSRFNAKQMEVGDGIYIDVPQSTTDMGTGDFMFFLESVKQFASQVLEIYIPEPNEQLFFNF